MEKHNTNQKTDAKQCEKMEKDVSFVAPARICL